MRQGGDRATSRAGSRRLLLASFTALLTGILLGLAGPASAVNAPVIQSPPAGTLVTTTSVAWTWTADPDVSISCLLTTPTTPAPVPAACASGSPLALGDGDGTYSLVVRATGTLADGTPTSADSLPSHVVLDTTAPEVRIDGYPPARDTSRTPTWTLFVAESLPATCALAGPGGVVLTSACGSGTWTADLTGQPEGSWSLTVSAQDAAGNPTTVTGTQDYVLDLAPPAPVVTAAVSPSNNTAPAWSFTVPADATGRCTLTGPLGTVVVAEQACASGWAPPLTAGNGTYTASVVLEDLGGRSDAGTATYTLDTVAPDAPQVTGSAGRSTNPALSWSFVVPAGDTARCTLIRNDVPQGEQGCTSPYTDTVSDGRYQLSVVLVDTAGNRSVAGLGPQAEVDTTPPPVPTFTSTPTSPNTGGPQQRFTWNWKDQVDVIQCQVRTGEAVLQAWDTCSGGTLTVSTALLDDGPVSLDLRSQDDLLNRSATATSTVLLDTTAPGAPVVTGSSGAGRDPNAVWSWGSAPDDRSTCRLLESGLPTTNTWTTCTSGSARTLPSDGAWSLQVRLTDLAGNTSDPSVSPTYVLDRVAPTAPSVSGPSGLGNVRDVVWTVDGEAGAAVTCQLELSGGVVEPWAPCPRTVSRTLATDGDWVLLATLTDAAGNTSFTKASTVYTLDTVAPGVPAVSGPTGPSNATVVTWTWAVTNQADTTATATCRLLRDAAVVQDWARCSTSERVTLSGDGRWLWQVRLTDAAGNTSGEGSSPVYLLDTVAPTAPVVSAPASPSSSRSPVFGIAGEAGASVECRVLHDGSVLLGWASCTRSVTVDLSSGAEGGYVVQARLTDAAGNTSLVGASAVYVLDTVAPTAPVVTGASGDSSSPTPTWSWTGESGAAAQCSLVRGTEVVVDWTSCASPWTPTLPSEGSWVLRVRLTDAAGNVGLSGTGPQYRYDATAPDRPTVTAPPSPSRKLQPSWSFAGEAGAAATCRLSGPDATSSWLACTSRYVTDLTGRPQGTYHLDVRLTDAAGNVSQAGRASYLLDTIAPNRAVVTAPPSPSSGSSPTWTVVVDEPSLTAVCRLLRDGTTVLGDAPCDAATTGSLYPVALAGRPDGRYRLEVVLTDLAGNRSAIAGADYVFDTTPPTTVTVAAPLSPGSSSTPTWQLLTEPGAQVQCRFADALAFTRCARDGSFRPDLTASPDGSYTLTVRAVDAAGNIGPASTTTYVLDRQEPLAPVVTAPTPSPGQDREPVWTWTAEPGSRATCSLVRDTTVVFAGPCSASIGTRLPQDGAYLLSITVADAAGNVSAPGTATYTLDTTPPELPVIVGPSSPSSIARPVFGFAAEAGAVVECRVSAGSTRSTLQPDPDGWQLCADGNLELVLEQEGFSRLEVRATDAAGNTSRVAAYLYEYDLDAPAGLQDLVLPKSPGNDRLPTWTFTAPLGSTTTCRLTGPRGKVQDGPCLDGFSPADPLNADGRYVLRIVVEDVNGNIGTNDLLYVLDTTGPEAPTVTPADLSGRVGQVQWGWVGDATATWMCQLEHDGRIVQRWQACTPGVQILGQWGDGVYDLFVAGVDGVGNRGPAGRGRYTWKSAGPAALGVTTTSPTVGGPGPVLWSFPVPSDAATVTCGVRRDGVFVTALSSCRGGYQMNLAGQRDGSYEVVVRFADSLGNVTEQVRTYVLRSSTPASPRPSSPAAPPRAVAAPAPPPPASGRAPAVDRPTVVIRTDRPATVNNVATVATVLAPVPDRGPRPAFVPAPGTSTGAPPEQGATEATQDGRDAGQPGLNLAGGGLSGAGAVEAIRDIATETIRRPQLPIALILLVLGFLLVQNRIDRRDPKLARAPVDTEAELDFRPLSTRTYPPVPRAGGAPA